VLNFLSEFFDISKMDLKTGRTKHHCPLLMLLEFCALTLDSLFMVVVRVER
jgi:hypothetical protein